ncbi:uncharacterized protein LTR77_004563 [Saxophila tyrrhenica]|uniref:Uncharacterized protein n=1 Tax=Saxophila tyrrhenica TaxID=1690608 RepID=A0AAV9PD89_9PEZI|nr:hypothetical protein LTR77_004563 [Saxophila tyrrhenica]
MAERAGDDQRAGEQVEMSKLDILAAVAADAPRAPTAVAAPPVAAGRTGGAQQAAQASLGLAENNNNTTAALTEEEQRLQQAHEAKRAHNQAVSAYIAANGHPDYMQHPAFPMFPTKSQLYTDPDERAKQISGYLHYVDACGFPTVETRAALCLIGLSLSDIQIQEFREKLGRDDVSEETKVKFRKVFEHYGYREFK